MCGGEREVFIDCGAFNGDTAYEFSERFRNYEGIVAFEPDKRNIEKLQARKLKNLHIVTAACSDFDGKASFSEEKDSGGSHLSTSERSECVERGADTHCPSDGQIAQTNEKVKVCRIDSVPECRNATFIKMDIEGAEMSALKGAEETIKRNHPRLAICLYHSNADMIDIPEYIHKLVPEYNLFVRAHTMGIAETVLYAIDRTRIKSDKSS